MFPGRGTLLMYGAGGFPLAALGLPLYVYLPTFYAEELGLGLATTGLILLMVRLFDLISDPLIGFVSDRRQWFGSRRRIYMLLGMPLLLLAVDRLFSPAAPVGGGYLLGWSLLAFLGWTLIAIPYTAWGAEISTDSHQRSRLSAYREGFIILGTLAALSLPLLVGTGADNGQTLKMLATLITITLPPALLLTRFVPEPATQRQQHRTLSGLQAIRQNRPMQRLLLSYLINNTANALPATLFILFVSHTLQAPEWIAPLLLAYFASGVLALPLWLALAKRCGKVTAWSGSMLLAAGAFLAVPFLGSGDVIAFLIICLISGLSLGADMALPASLQADVADIDRRLSGRERTGLLFGIWGMLTKLALALAVGIAFPLLQLAGFNDGVAPSEGALLTLSLLYGLLPVLLKLLSLRLLRGLQLSLRGSHDETSIHAASATPACTPAVKRV